MKLMIKNIIKAVAIAMVAAPLGATALLSSCVKTDSELVEFADDHNLNSPNDSVYSILGIINKMQTIADRTIILGELRGDLTVVTDAARKELQDIANFTATTDNPYNNISDYYAVIQNCNYYLANIDTAITKRGEKVFIKEFAVVKAYRAWTYLQLAINYGEVPFVTTPILAEKDADISLYPKKNIKEIAEYFAEDLAPYVDTKLPAYGAVGNYDSRWYYFPIRALLGELCLWAEKYNEAAQYYHDYFTLQGNPQPIGAYSASWNDEITNPICSSPLVAAELGEALTIMPMELEEYDGIVSYLDDVFESTTDNNYFYQAIYSPGLYDLSQRQKFCRVKVNASTQTRDTLYIPEDQYYENQMERGDLRLANSLSLRKLLTSNENYNDQYLTNYKLFGVSGVSLMRLTQLYLHYAEALNRAGFPETAFAVLKHGLCEDNLQKTDAEHVTTYVINERERTEIGTLATFSRLYFNANTVKGIHSRGTGDANANKYYVIPECASREDSILAVENFICDELALETLSEGCRFGDLVRIAQHRGDDTEFFADRVARRVGSFVGDAAGNRDEDLYQRLKVRKNWFLPMPQ